MTTGADTGTLWTLGTLIGVVCVIVGLWIGLRIDRRKRRNSSDQS